MAIQTFYTGPTAAELAQIPDDLKMLPQWVLFQILEVPDAKGELKLNKIPINPHTFEYGSTTDPDTWAAYDQCVNRLPRALHQWDALPPTTYKDKPATYCGAGLGFVLTTDDPYLLVDMDHSIDEAGGILPWAHDILTTLHSYSQISVSGRGLHTLIKGHLPPGGQQHGNFQTWETLRFVAMTGRHLPETPATIEARQSQFTMVHAAYILKPKAEAEAAKPQTKRDQRSTISGPPHLSNNAILAKARDAKNGAPFDRLWSGDWSGYPSQSEGDLALCCHLAFWTRDIDQLDSLFRQSGLYREDKWSDRDDYREGTIDKALDQVTTWYDPEAYKAERETHERRNGHTTNTKEHEDTPAQATTEEHSGHAPPPAPAPALLTRCAAEVMPEPIQWLWPPYIALGCLSMLDGDPGIGKSLLMLQLAANISRGYPFPDYTGRPTLQGGEAANVLILTREDSLSMVIRPRLDASGADAHRVFVSGNWLDAHGDAQGFTLKHLPLLRDEIARLEPRLVVLDPIQSFLGDIDMHRANQTRPLLDGLAALAEQARCAIVCIRHPAKPGEGIGKAIHRGLGSIDFIGCARTGLFIEQDPTDETRAFMAQTKSNLGPKGRTQIFSKKEGVFGWVGVTRLSAEDLAGSGRGPQHNDLLEAALWLEKRLEGNLPLPASELEGEAQTHDINSRTLRRAKKLLGVVSAQNKGGLAQGWTWHLPPLAPYPVPTWPSVSSVATEPSEPTRPPVEKSNAYDVCMSVCTDDTEGSVCTDGLVGQVVSADLPADMEDF